MFYTGLWYRDYGYSIEDYRRMAETANEQENAEGENVPPTTVVRIGPVDIWRWVVQKMINKRR